VIVYKCCRWPGCSPLPGFVSDSWSLFYLQNMRHRNLHQ